MFNRAYYIHYTCRIFKPKMDAKHCFSKFCNKIRLFTYSKFIHLGGIFKNVSNV